MVFVFQSGSTRTGVAFEVGMYQLGGSALFLSSHDLQIGRGEPIEDTARVLSRYLDGIMIRTYKQQEVEDLAKFGSVPVINGLTDYAHPCQVLADLMTVREHKGALEGLKFCYVGDGNNMANSLIAGCLTMGMEVSIACPKGFEPAHDVLEAAKKHGDMFHLTHNIYEAADEADVVYTDVWASMGQESEAITRRKAFKGYQVNDDLLNVAAHYVMVLHCLPAHRGGEITAEVMAEPGEIEDQAENGPKAQKALLAALRH